MLQAQEACGVLEIDGALDQIYKLDTELVEVRRSANEGQLRPLPGETVSYARRHARTLVCAKKHSLLFYLNQIG